MSQLLRAGPEEIAALRGRSQRCCIAFSDEPFPPGASRASGRVGLETDPLTGRSLLHVERGVVFEGSSAEVGEWFAAGTRAFATYDELQDWLAGPLAATYGANPSTSNRHSRPAVESVVIGIDELAAALEDEVIGQNRCARDLARTTVEQLARVQPRRPLTVLALGPTGVGKTLMAESLASAIRSVADVPCDYLRLDMTEFQERHTVSKLLGAPPGYVGFGDEPQLVRTLRNGARAVVLIDEIEKAHPDVFLAIMNLMDAGRLTPASGDPIDARHAILLFTTNLAADTVGEAIARAGRRTDDPIARDSLVRSTLRAHGIAPALVGRLHQLLVFRQLDDEHLDALLIRSIEREARTFGLEALEVAPQVVVALRADRPDPGSGVRAWEHLVCTRLGGAFLAARRQGIVGSVALRGKSGVVEVVAC